MSMSAFFLKFYIREFKSAYLSILPRINFREKAETFFRG